MCEEGSTLCRQKNRNTFGPILKLKIIKPESKRKTIFVDAYIGKSKNLICHGNCPDRILRIGGYPEIPLKALSAFLEKGGVEKFKLEFTALCVK